MSQTVEPGINTELEPEGPAQSDSKVDRWAQWRELVTVPRWAIYCQAALLGIIATTFFVFGMMVGSLTSNSTEVNATFDCRVVGSVAYRIDGDLKADDGAVIL